AVPVVDALVGAGTGCGAARAARRPLDRVPRRAAASRHGAIRVVPVCRDRLRSARCGAARPGRRHGPEELTPTVPHTATADPLLEWRREFPTVEATLHFASHTLGAMPRGVEDALR